MANLTNNRIKATIDGASHEEIKQLLDNLREKMYFLTGLTIDERKKLPKMNVANKVFTEKVLNHARNNPGLLPPYLDVEGMSADLLLFTQLDEIQMVLSQLLESVEDTRMLAGSEAYVVALGCRKHFEAAAKAGLPGADTICEDLDERFKSHSKYKNLG